MAVTMNAEQLTASLAQLTQLVTQFMAAEAGRRGGDADAVASSTTASKGTKSHKKVFEQKSFGTLDKFGEGNAEQFQDWSYQVKMLTKGESE